MNQLKIDGTVLEVKPVRYTPAGIAVLELTLNHESTVQQATNQQRQVQLDLSVVAMGDMALLLSDLTLGTQLQVSGFLAPIRKNSSKLVLHIQQANRINDQSLVV